MQLEPEIQDYVDFCESFDIGEALSFDNVALQRSQYLKMRAALAEDIPQGLYIEDRSVTANDGHNIPIRIYRAEGQSKQACCLFFHGGGFVVGSIESHHDFIAELAAMTDVCIVSVEYRLSPEVQYPVALHDCRDVLLELVQNPETYDIDPNNISISGDSAGGTLTAALCLLARDQGLADIKGQLLIYPWCGSGVPGVALDAGGDVPLLRESEVSFYAQAYFGDADIDTYAAPLLEEDFKGMPPAFILTVEYDSVRADGFAYAQRLRGAGVVVEHYDAPGLVHGCVQARRSSPGTRLAFQRWAEALKAFAQNR